MNLRILFVIVCSFSLSICMEADNDQDYLTDLQKELKVIIIKYAINQCLRKDDIFNALYNTKRFIASLLPVNKVFYNCCKEYYDELIEYTEQQAKEYWALEESTLGQQELDSKFTKIVFCELNSCPKNASHEVIDAKVGQAAKYLIAGSNPNFMSSPDYCQYINNESQPIVMNILVFVIRREHLHKLIPILISKEASVNAKQDSIFMLSVTPLHQALRYPDIINLLLRHKANINILNEDCNRCLSTLALNFKFKFINKYTDYQQDPVLEVLKLFIKYNPGILEKIKNHEVENINYSILKGLLNSSESHNLI